MAYAIIVKPSAKRELSRLPREVQRRIAERIDELARSPRPPGAETYRGRQHSYRTRVGDYRIVYEVDDSRAEVWVFLIGHRKDVYRRQ